MAKSKIRNPLVSIRGSLVLIGAGKMGGALLQGWLARGLPPKKIVVIEPQPSKAIKALGKRGVRINPALDRKRGIGDVTAMVVAVKPQTAPEALPAVAGLVGARTVVVSIMAGRTLNFLQDNLPGAAIVRAMPNTPAAIGRGITVAVGNRRTNAAARKLADALLAATGTVEWIQDEALMDAVTAVSGSGPAYVFLLIEALAEAGAKVGLPADLALRLARATVAGAGELARLSPEGPGKLRENVTSPGGTTRAALDVLMAENGLAELLERAVAAATARSRELAS